MEPTGILTFGTLEEANEHMDTGYHVMLPEKECVYDTFRRQWADTTTSVKGKSPKIGDGTYSDEATVQEEASQGWACKKQKSALEFHQWSRNTSHECSMKVPWNDTQKQTQPTSQKTKNENLPDPNG